jgi:hypothetical protein
LEQLSTIPIETLAILYLIPQLQVKVSLFQHFRISDEFSIILTFSELYIGMVDNICLETYAAAVGISCGVAVGMGEFVKRAPFSPTTRNIIQKVTKFLKFP